jgi:hypothetical protein
MTINKMLITPEYAKSLLRMNTSNRKVNKNFVERYAKDISDGRWCEDTGETIKIANDGTILDGQHRLIAVVQSGVPVYFHVVTGLDKKIMSFIDTGKARNASDVFSLNRIPNHNSIPSMITMYESMNMGAKYAHANTKKYLTNDVLLTKYRERPEYWQEVARNVGVWYTSFAKILPPSILGGMYVYLSDIDEESSFEFFSQLSSGMNVNNDTIHLLRNKLMKDKISIKKIPILIKVALIIKTWNYYRIGKTVTNLVYYPSEPFPTPQ